MRLKKFFSSPIGIIPNIDPNSNPIKKNSLDTNDLINS
jgi:hypothetical protein